MGWLDWLTGKKQPNPMPERRPPASPPINKVLSRDELAEVNTDVLDGWRLSITLSSTTPLKWLLQHGKSAPKPSDVPQQFGIWIPKTKSFRELGFDIDELPPSTMASEIGQIPSDGGDFLPFLILFRRIVEADDERETILDRLSALGEKHPNITAKMGGNIAQSFVVSELASLPGCGTITAERLFHAGLLSKEQVLKSSADELTAINGIGPSTARKILGLKSP